jgi:hypothetical protein
MMPTLQELISFEIGGYSVKIPAYLDKAYKKAAIQFAKLHVQQFAEEMNDSLPDSYSQRDDKELKEYVQEYFKDNIK